MLRQTLRAWVVGAWLSSLAACAGSGETLEQPSSDTQAPVSIEAFTAELEPHPGFVPLWTDPRAGRVYAEFDALEALECLHVEALARGLGANPVGLDRGEHGGTVLLRVRVVGERVLFEAINTGFRASSGDPDEREATERAFPTSILAAVPVVAREGDRVLVDLDAFLVRDAHRVAAHLARREEGKWTLEPDASAVELGALRAFPDNVELEVTLSYQADTPGAWSTSTAPLEDRFSLRQHYSFVRLPEPGFVPREVPTRMGAMGLDYLDFSAPLEHPLHRELSLRHRLEPGHDLVYYLDRGTPEPIRGALLEGASWWTEAFEQAGVPGGFRVELLPKGADPLDHRYNMINWVHRSTRGWSYGGSVIDPRTGEILKGNVTLGSQRVRQDRRIFEALLGAGQSGKGGPTDPVELALTRIRQLAAHEVGHTLGFRHNFAASSYGRESVMDYPAPLVHLEGEGEAAHLDVSSAYSVGIGDWDRLAFAYLYREWAEPGEQVEGLAALLQEADERGLWLLSDNETHPRGAAHPEAAVWDNGSDSVAELREVLAVRSHALERFGPDKLALKADPSELELSLGPLYFYHRYQLTAAAKRIGGQRHELGPTLHPTITAVSPAQQREAIAAVVATLDPAVLGLPGHVLELMRPTPGNHIDGLPSYAGPAFDPYALAAAAAAMTVAELLVPERAHRLETLHARDAQMPSFSELLAAAVGQLWGPSSRPAGDREAALLLELAREAFVEGLVALDADPSASPRVRALAQGELTALGSRLARAKGDHDRRLAARITRWLERARTEPPRVMRAPEPPPGSPIGSPGAALLPCGQGGSPWAVSPVP